MYTMAITKTVTLLIYATNMFSSTKGIRFFLWFALCRPRQGSTSSPPIYRLLEQIQQVTFRPIFSFPGAFVSLFFIRPFEWHPFQRRSANVTYILQVVSCKCMSHLRFISQSVSLLKCTFVML